MPWKLGIFFGSVFNFTNGNTFAYGDAAITKIKIAADYGTIGCMAVLIRRSKINICIISNRIYYEVINIE
jgi:hypothetical protein